METLSCTPDINGFVNAVAQVTLVTGREIWVCNPMDELTSAMASGQPFKAHTVVSLKPNEIVINPEHVVCVEASGR